jgi:hypothetical protein
MLKGKILHNTSSQLSQTKSASKGCATQRGSFTGIHNNKPQTMKMPPKDVQLQGRRPITPKHNLNSKLNVESEASKG